MKDEWPPHTLWLKIPIGLCFKKKKKTGRICYPPANKVAFGAAAEMLALRGLISVFPSAIGGVANGVNMLGAIS